MTTDENILVEMLERATNPVKENFENFAVQMFCMIVQSNSDLVGKAHQLIVNKMQSSNTIEAIRAIGLLEECMSKAGTEFQKKTAKFSFLNELISLVLDKHQRPPAALEIKKRIMECLMLWTVKHPDKSKIQEAYDNLKKQVNFGPDSSSSMSTSLPLTKVREQHSSILGDDDKLVAKLLKQGGVENYKKVNLLIQKWVNQETRRTEFICHLKGEMKKVESTMEVLGEMLDSYSPDASESDSRDIIIDLYNNCTRHYTKMEEWQNFLPDAEPDFLEDFINTKELLLGVIQRYKEIFEKKEFSIQASLPTSRKNSDILSELLGDTLNTSSQEMNQTNLESPVKANDTLDQLNEIFGSITDNVELNKPHHPSDILGSSTLLEPISVFESGSKDKSATANLSMIITSGMETKKAQGNELREIDKLSEELFKQSLKEEQRLLSFKRDTEKLTLNDMVKDKKQASPNVTEKTLKTLETKEENKISETSCFEDKEENDENYLKIIDIPEKSLKLKNESEYKSSREGAKSSPLKPLAEISIDLDEITPLDEGQRLILDDDDVQVTLYFTADRPSEHVSVIVMNVSNKSKLPVKDFQFEASVKKPCKVRLLPPTEVDMAPRKPFRPSTPINQVILLLNPTQKPVDIICIIGYKLGDDPDPIKESIVARNIPYI